MKVFRTLFKTKPEKKMLQALADEVLKSVFVKAKTMEEFVVLLDEWRKVNPTITDPYTYQLYKEVAQIVISTNPQKVGSKLRPSGTFNTAYIQRFLGPHTKTVLYWVSIGATDAEIKEVLVEYVKKLIY